MSISTYDFDAVIDRTGTSCIKYDAQMQRMGRSDLLPLWVADMDFQAPSEMLSDLHARIDHGIFGYTDPDEHYYAAVNDWFSRHYNKTVAPDTITVTPGVVYALAAAVRAFTQPGEGVIIQQPVYYPFKEVIEDNDRVLVNSPLLYDRENGRYTMDYDDFEEKVTSNKVKLFLLCNPHNPVGRVWTPEELKKIGDICIRHGVTVFSDEIHCDFIFTGQTFTPFTALGQAYTDICVTGTSASKTFNIAGLQAANIIIENPKLRALFRRANSAAGYSQGNVLGMLATQSVYEKGDVWLTDLLAYLEGNLSFTREYLRQNTGGRIRLIEPEGTYLLWLDCRDLGLSVDALEDLILNKAHLWLDSGKVFGAAGEGFQRINMACPRSVLQKALEQLCAAVSTLA